MGLQSIGNWVISNKKIQINSFVPTGSNVATGTVRTHFHQIFRHNRLQRSRSRVKLIALTHPSEIHSPKVSTMTSDAESINKLIFLRDTACDLINHALYLSLPFYLNNYVFRCCRLYELLLNHQCN